MLILRNFYTRGWDYYNHLLLSGARNGNVKKVRIALNQGAYVDIRDSVDRSALSIASLVGNTSMMDILIKNGAQINMQNNIGMTALHYAVRNGAPNVVNNLINKGASLVRNRYGNTAIDIATEQGYTDLVNILAKHYDVAIPDNNNETLENIPTSMTGAVSTPTHYLISAQNSLYFMYNISCISKFFADLNNLNKT
ncbi:MAG: ankyrin repeat domain-containing protein [Gammaproteobacteria bacterium]|nr:ankyrin repeat domain-containing protein [Gammaproteobacteria bacterium]